MTIGFIGLGKMGTNMVERLIGGGHTLIVYDRNPEAAAASCQKGARGTDSLSGLADLLDHVRIIWIMVPSKVIDTVVTELLPLLSEGDIIIDGGNSYYKDTIRRVKAAGESGIKFIDAGTSGGLSGLTEGYCIMAGGDSETIEFLRPVFTTLAPGKAFLHTGPAGSGHFVKMVHNGIEYGIMQAYAEGFELLLSKPEFALDSSKVADNWRHGSVIRSWLLDLLQGELQKDPCLTTLNPWIEDSGEGRWTVQEGIESGTPLPVITAALYTRFYSRDTNSFAARALAALRLAFGGHKIKNK